MELLSIKLYKACETWARWYMKNRSKNIYIPRISSIHRSRLLPNFPITFPVVIHVLSWHILAVISHPPLHIIHFDLQSYYLIKSFSEGGQVGKARSYTTIHDKQWMDVELAGYSGGPLPNVVWACRLTLGFSSWGKNTVCFHFMYKRRKYWMQQHRWGCWLI